MEIPILDSQIENPILVDVRTGKVTPATWRDKGARTIAVAVKDSVVAVADASYLNWPRTPEAPGALVAKQSDDQVELEWKAYGNSNGFEIQRSADWGSWQKVTELKSDQSRFSERLPSGKHITYRVRALGVPEPSAWSNPAWVDRVR